MPKLCVGLDVSLEMTSVCAVDEEGVIRLETKAISDPAAIAAVLGKLDGAFDRVGLEAGPLSPWLYFGLRDAGLPAVCIEARHAKAAIRAMSANKTDRNDACSIAQLVRSGWFKTVHVKSVESQELWRLLVTREFFVNKLRDHENEVRGLLRPFGLKVGAAEFEGRVRELVRDSPRIAGCMGALLRARAAMRVRLGDLGMGADIAADFLVGVPPMRLAVVSGQPRRSVLPFDSRAAVEDQVHGLIVLMREHQHLGVADIARDVVRDGFLGGVLDRT